MTELAAHLGSFFQEHLPRDRRASQHTIESYAYSFQLFAGLTADKLGIQVTPFTRSDSHRISIAS